MFQLQGTSLHINMSTGCSCSRRFALISCVREKRRHGQVEAPGLNSANTRLKKALRRRGARRSSARRGRRRKE
jgi:hypothetical protein